jgi:CRISPR/Cas system type I-B associated protein Csh2 (Cas7 group RAMP superfamily)
VTEIRPQLAKNLSYTNEELLRIEAVLLEKTEIDSSEDELFEGLMAVVDVLFDVHSVEDGDLRDQAKAAFDGQEYSTVEAVL